MMEDLNQTEDYGQIEGIQQIFAGDVGRETNDYDSPSENDYDLNDPKPFKQLHTMTTLGAPNTLKMKTSNKDTLYNFENSILFMEDYRPISNLINMKKLRETKSFSVRKFNDAIYMGEFLEDGESREGLGIMVYKHGRIYEGSWKNGLREGKGFEKYANSNTYEGEFHRGKPNGKGIYRWLNGELYEGEWYQGLKHGYGIWKGRNGDYYMGEWRNSKAEGYGVHIWKNGERYEGEWKGFVKHGKGCDLYNNGDVYIGYFKYGKFEGYGQFIWNDGAIYDGDFKLGLKNGKGKWRRLKDDPNSNQYEGEYENDHKNGYGTFKWQSGNIYRGEYKIDEREGFGEMQWIDGSKYVGQWEKGIQHGYGRIVLPDKTIKEGYFENNIYRGAIPPSYGLSDKSPYSNNALENSSVSMLSNNISAGKIPLSKGPIDINTIHQKTINIIVKNQQILKIANSYTSQSSSVGVKRRKSLNQVDIKIKQQESLSSKKPLRNLSSFQSQIAISGIQSREKTPLGKYQ